MKNIFNRSNGFILLMILNTFSVAGAAAYYSVFGLSSLFAGAKFEVIIMAAALEVATGGLRSIFGKEKNTDIVDKLDDVIDAIQGMDINMDGEKVGFLTKVRDTFRRKK